MPKYKNTSRFPKKFYGVKFAPGAVEEVPGWINDSAMFRVNDKTSAFTSSEGSNRKSGRKRTKAAKVEVVEESLVVDKSEPVKEETEEPKEGTEAEITEDAPF